MRIPRFVRALGVEHHEVVDDDVVARGGSCRGWRRTTPWPKVTLRPHRAQQQRIGQPAQHEAERARDPGRERGPRARTGGGGQAAAADHEVLVLGEGRPPGSATAAWIATGRGGGSSGGSKLPPSSLTPRAELL